MRTLKSSPRLYAHRAIGGDFNHRHLGIDAYSRYRYGPFQR